MESSGTPPTPKTHVILASEAPAAVVLYRRSHLTTYCLTLDYRRSGKGFRDRLTAGSRFYGRLFPHRCDLSPDGELMVYFAMRGRRTNGSADPSTWTAVCTPPWLKAHLFYPNGSTWGGGGMFLRDKTLVVFESTHRKTGPDYTSFGGYRIARELKSLCESEQAQIMARFKPPIETRFPQTTGAERKRRPVLVRTMKPHTPDNYNLYDYRLQDSSGNDIEGAEEIILADWAGWDIYGRLWAAAGRYLSVYAVAPRKPMQKPVKVLDLESAIKMDTTS